MESKLNSRILFKIECKSVNCHPISCLSTETYCEEWPRKAAGLWKPQVLSVRPGYQDEAAWEICDDEELVITRLWLGQGGSLWRQRCGLHRPGIPGSSLSLRAGLSVAANCDKTTERDLALERPVQPALLAATSPGPELPRCLCSQVRIFLNYRHWSR